MGFWKQSFPLPFWRKHRLPWALLLFLVLFSLIVTAGACYQIIASRLEAGGVFHPGHLVSVGKFKLNLYCIGQGGPTVVLEAGLADSLDSWRRVQPEIASFSRVCSYDRAGYGSSEPGPMPRTSVQIAMELHDALQNAGERPPYLLVGHSFGGFNVRVFNGKYPKEVVGLVLVDATQEDQYHLLPRAWSNLGTAMRQRADRQAFWAPVYVGLGIARLQFLFQSQKVSPLLLQSKYLKARASEFGNIEVSAEQARNADRMEGKPLLVLTAAKPADDGVKAALGEQDWRAYEKIWIEDLQLRLTRLSRQGSQIIVPDSGHDMPTDRPDAIVAAVRQFCTTSRASSPQTRRYGPAATVNVMQNR